METIIDQVISYLLGAVERYRKQHEKTKGDLIGKIQLLFMLTADGMAVSVWYCENFVPKEETTVKKAMNKRLDIMGIAGATEAFIGNAIGTLSQKDSIPMADVRIMAVPNQDEGIDLHLYNRNNAVRQIDVNEIFDPALLKQ